MPLSRLPFSQNRLESRDYKRHPVARPTTRTLSALGRAYRLRYSRIGRVTGARKQTFRQRAQQGAHKSSTPRTLAHSKRRGRHRGKIPNVCTHCAPRSGHLSSTCYTCCTRTIRVRSRKNRGRPKWRGDGAAAAHKSLARATSTLLVHRRSANITHTHTQMVHTACTYYYTLCIL